MQLVDYIDYWGIFKKIKTIQLEEYPTARDYIEFLDSVEEKSDFVEEMYVVFNINFDEFESNSSDNDDDFYLVTYLSKQQLFIELSIGGNDANESTNYNEWGYGYQFTVDLVEERFIDYTYENYS